MATVKRVGGALEIECSRCKSLVEFTSSDVVIDDMGIQSDHLRCPVCGNIHELNKLKIPAGWNEAIRQRCEELGI